MTAVTNVILISLLKASELFGTGITSYQEQDYAAALTAFSAITQQSAGQSELAVLSRFWRARSLAHLDKGEEAVQDLVTVLNARVPDDALMNAAGDLYFKLTGKPWEGHDLMTPGGTWETFLAGLKARDEEAVRRCFTGALLKEMNQGLAGGDFWEEAGSILKMQLERVDYGSGKRDAVVHLSQGGEAVALRATRVQGAWLFSGEADVPRKRRQDEWAGEGDFDPSSADSHKLQLIRNAIEAYVLQYSRMPAILDDLRDHINEFDAMSRSSLDSKAFVMSTPRRGIEQPATPWVFTSSAVNDFRMILAFGQVREVSEEEFNQLSLKYGVSGDVEGAAEALSDAEKARIGALIEQLGDVKFERRKNAFLQLKDLGALVIPFLKQATQHDDPEVSFQAQQLLSEL